MDRTFQVDLRGIVDLLSHHLYASPRVYVRELLQNAVDAITARGSGQGRVRIEPPELTGDGTLRISDNGIGLTEAQVHEFLATIGRSSKRDDLGFARHDFLGQFGIGLLSCFLVADEIRVDTRAASGETIRWIGYADGRYTIAPAPQPGAATAGHAVSQSGAATAGHAVPVRSEQGTTVTLVPRRYAEQWMNESIVTELATLYGSMLPVSVYVGHKLVTVAPPWTTEGRERRGDLTEYCQSVFGFTPFDVVDLHVPEAGLHGAAFVLPVPANPAARAGHRVYLKRMLLAEGAEGVLPEWAFFARCVVDTTELRPTASREALYEDALLRTAREALGDQLRGWLVKLATRDPRRLAAFLDIHHLGVKALALHDDEMLRLVESWWPMETTAGRMTLAEFREQYGLIRYIAKHDEFRQVGAVAAAQNLPLVNAGYAYDAELIERLPTVDRSLLIERMEPSDLTTAFEPLDPGIALATRPFVTRAQRAVDRLGCEVLLRSYDPAGLPALYLVSRSAAFSAELRATRDRVDEIWAGVLDSLSATAEDERPQLVLNYRNPLVRRVTELGDDELVGLAVEALYGQALLLGHHPIRPADAALLNSSFLGLLNRAVPDA